MGNIYFRRQYKKIGSNKFDLEIIIDTPVVTRELIDYIIANEHPISISFTEKVKVLDKNCFYHLNIDRVSFDSAIGLEEIREGAFKKAINLHCVDSFENVNSVGKSAFEECQSEDTLYLPNLKIVPEKCFENAKFWDLCVPNAEQIPDSATLGLQLGISKSV